MDIIELLKRESWTITLAKNNRQLGFDATGEKWMVIRGIGKGPKSTLYEGVDFDKAIEILQTGKK